MATWNSNLAYALPVQEQAAPAAKPAEKKLRVVKTRRQFLVSAITPGNVFVFLLAVVVVCLMVYNYVCLNEVTGEISRLSEEYRALENVNVALHSELSSSVSPRVLADQAGEMGLQKLGKYQTEYVNIYHEDTIEQGENAPGESLSLRIKTFLNAAISAIQEYIAER